MRKMLLSFVLLMLGFTLGYGGLHAYTLFRSSKTKVLSLETEKSPTATVTPSYTPSPTVTPTPLPTATTTPLPTSSPTPKPSPTPVAAPSDMDHLFNQYAIEYNVEKQLLVRIAFCESRFNTTAINGDYAGLYQFARERWISYRTTMGHDTNPDLRINANEAIKTAAHAISRGKLFMWPHCSKP